MGHRTRVALTAFLILLISGCADGTRPAGTPTSTIAATKATSATSTATHRAVQKPLEFGDRFWAFDQGRIGDHTLLAPGAPPTITMDQRGMGGRGFDGCNSYTFVIDDRAVATDPGMVCRRMQLFQSLYLEAIGDVAEIADDRERLTLTGPRSVLHFTALERHAIIDSPIEVAGVTWQYIGGFIGHRALISPTPGGVTMRIDDDGKGGTGSGACNTYGFSITRGGPGLRISGADNMTEVFCSTALFDDFYHRALNGVTQMELLGDLLFLHGDDIELRYREEPRDP